MSAPPRKTLDYARLREPGSRVLREWNAQRQAAKAGATSGPQFRAFTGGGVDRLTQSWVPANTAINVDLEAQLPLLRARSRSLWANTAFGRRFARLIEINVVGPHGFALEATVKRKDGTLDEDINTAIETAFTRWKKALTCDIAGRMDFDSMCRLILKMVAREGECPVRKVRGRNINKWGLALQVLDPDRIDHWFSTLNTNGDITRMGVQVQPTGRISGHWVLSAHPGDTRTYATATREFVPSSDMVNLFPVERAEQLRGIPWMHAILIDSRNLAGFEEAALIAARAGASKFGWLKQTAESAPDLWDESENGKNLGAAQVPTLDFSPGTMGTLPWGWDVGTFDAKYPESAFDPFVTAVMHRLASGLDVAHHNLSGNMTGVNYSSARIAEMAERDVWRTLQAWFIESFLRELGREWLWLALLNGQITLPNGKPLDANRLAEFQESLSWVPRGWDWVDPKNETASSVEAIDNGLDSRTANLRRRGRDVLKVAAELKREKELFAGLFNPPPAAAAAPVPPNQDTTP